MSNNIEVTGNLGKDAKAGFTKDGKAWVMFSVADTPKAKDGQRPEAIWWNCSAWEGVAESVMDKLTKGTRVKVTGWLKSDSWLDKNTGEKRSGLKLTAKTIDIIERKKEAEDDQPF